MWLRLQNWTLILGEKSIGSISSISFVDFPRRDYESKGQRSWNFEGEGEKGGEGERERVKECT